MNKVSKVFAILLIISCLFSTACSKPEAGTNNGITVTTSLKGKPTLVGNIPCEFPLVTDDTSLNIMMCGYETQPSEDIYVFQKYKEMTGVHVNWTNVTKAKTNESVYTALINKSDVDLFMRCKVNANLLIQYGQSGYIYDLAKDDMLKNNAPNCWAFLQSHPLALASITNPDGSIYALPQVNAGPELRVSRKLFVNKKWLKNVNMDLPTTTEEFYLMLKAFKEQDANGNGDPNDEIPLCCHDWYSVEDIFLGSFGLANRGVHNQIVDFDEDTGEIRLIAASDDYKAYLEYLNRLYQEELLDNYIFTMTMEQWINNAANDRVGVFANTNFATTPADKVDDYIAIEEPLTGPNGDKLCSAIRADFHSTGDAVIPTTCDNPELVLRWLDYFWTDEGTLFYHMGIEGETFVVKEDGSYDYASKIYEEINSGSKSFDDVVATYSPYPGGGNPTVEIAPYFRGGEMADIPAQAARKLFEYGPKEYWPCFTFTSEENEQLNVYQSDITKYCSAMQIDFITGTKPFSEWDEYTAQIDKLGKDKVLAVYQAAVDRYNVLVQSQK